MDLIIPPQDIFVPQRPVMDAAKLQSCMYEAATAYSFSNIFINKNDITTGA